jgi:hypothetical protein
VVKKVAFVVFAMGSTLFASGCVQDLWNAAIAGAAKYTATTVETLLNDFLPF